ncbi:MAG: hypothetical protein ACXWMN_08210 [Candidatus Limnocylindria bacterium]
MIERRGVRGVRDVGVRTRRTDRPDVPSTPHGLPAWISTFNLRWVDHLQRRPKGGKDRAA